MADTSLQSPYDPKGALPKSKWKLYQHGTKGTYKIIKVGAAIPEGFGQVPNTGAFSKHANVRKKMQDLKSKGSPFDQKFKSPGSGKAGQPTYGDIIKRLGGNLGKFAKYAVKTTGAALALEAGIVALGRGQGLNKEQKAVFKAAGVPRSIWGGESQGVFRDQVASMERAKQRQAERDTAKKEKADKAELEQSRKKEGIGAAPYGPKPKAPTSVKTRTSFVPEAPAKKPGASSPTVAVGNVGKIRKKQKADKLIADNLKEIEEKEAKKNIVKSTTRGLPKTATDLPFEAGPKRERATRKTVRNRTNIGGRPSKVSPAPGSVTGEKEAFMRREEKVTPRPETSIERSKRMQPQVAAKLKDAQKRLAPSNTAITRRGPRVEDMQGSGMGATTAAPRPAPPRPGFKPRPPSQAGEPVPSQGGFDPRPGGWTGHKPGPFSSATKKRPPGDVTGEKQAFMKRTDAAQKAKSRSLTSRQRSNLPTAKVSGAPIGAKPVGKLGTEGFGRLGTAHRLDVTPEASKTRPKQVLSAAQKKDISGAVKKQKRRELATAATPGMAPAWRNPDLAKVKGTRGTRSIGKPVIDPKLKQERRGQYSVTEKQKRDWEELEREQGGRRKGGKITKKSSTSRRSRPKNPTLQKTSYNY